MEPKMNRQPDYDVTLTESSARLQDLSSIADELDRSILKFDADPDDTDLCVVMVQQVLRARQICDVLVFKIIPKIRMECEQVADAVEMARGEVAKRILGVEVDINRITNRTSETRKPSARILRLVGS
jgi:hypothetical protein